MAFKDHTITAYRLATLPLRWCSGAMLRRMSQMPVTGIFLHRIADDNPNDWTITTEQFDAMIEWLEANVDLVSLDEAQNRLRHGNRGRVAVNISFDDGYADNCLHAIPMLIRKKIPFTYYVTTKHIKTGEPFPHDAELGQNQAPNSIDELRAMAEAGVELGAHTRTHANIGKLTELADIEYEIRGSREDLAEWIGYQPRHFAFPYGLAANLSDQAIQFLHDEGFESYCTAYGGYNFPQTHSPFHLRRFHGDPVLSRVKNWLSLDPRWMFAPPEASYVPIEQSQHNGIEKNQPTASALAE